MHGDVLVESCQSMANRLESSAGTARSVLAEAIKGLPYVRSISGTDLHLTHPGGIASFSQYPEGKDATFLNPEEELEITKKAPVNTALLAKLVFKSSEFLIHGSSCEEGSGGRKVPSQPPAVGVHRTKDVSTAESGGLRTTASTLGDAKRVRLTFLITEPNTPLRASPLNFNLDLDCCGIMVWGQRRRSWSLPYPSGRS